MAKPKRREQWHYTFLLLLVCVVLGFGITKLFQNKQEDNPEASLPDVTETDTLPSSEMLTASASETETLQETDTAAISETETESDTETDSGETSDTTEDAIPVSIVSSDGNMHMDRQHIYLRVNHTKDIPLRLTGGIARSQIEWSTDNNDIIDIADGTITGLMPGDCTITARAGADVLEIPVTVRELYVIDGCTYVDGILIANKTYSLPHDYDPGTLPVTQEAFEALAEDAAAEGLDIYEGSAYRDYDFQVTVYNSMVRGYNKEYADAYSARPGHSEHQTGYTIDCNTIDDAFGETRAGKWLADHCHEYGFIIRYPRGKEAITGYAYESWHIRYVGVEHATAIWQQHLTLEEYLDIDSVYPDSVPESEE